MIKLRGFAPLPVLIFIAAAVALGSTGYVLSGFNGDIFSQIAALKAPPAFPQPTPNHPQNILYNPEFKLWSRSVVANSWSNKVNSDIFVLGNPVVPGARMSASRISTTTGGQLLTIHSANNPYTAFYTRQIIGLLNDRSYTATADIEIEAARPGLEYIWYIYGNNRSAPRMTGGIARGTLASGRQTLTFNFDTPSANGSFGFTHFTLLIIMGPNEDVQVKIHSIHLDDKGITIDTIPPTVSIATPSEGPVSGITAVTATVTDNVGVAGVQFKLDDTNLGVEDTTAPYATNWDTTTATNGVHTLSAVARDKSGNSRTSAAVNVTVSSNVATCSLDGTTVAHDASKTFYTTRTSTTACSSQTRTCTNGTLSGNVAYQYASCAVVAPNTSSCTPNGTTVVSGISTWDATDTHAAVELSFIHPAWTASIPGATWIWSDNPVTDGGITLTKVFTHSFNLSSAPTAAVLSLATDNNYSISLNGTSLGSGGSSFTSVAQRSIAIPKSAFIVGTNSLSISVTNVGVPGSSPSGNPAGLLYKLSCNNAVTPASKDPCAVQCRGMSRDDYEACQNCRGGSGSGRDTSSGGGGNN